MSTLKDIHKAFDWFQYQVCHVELRFTETAIFPKNKGSLLRNALMSAFRRTVCPFTQKLCEDCLISSHCMYTQLFEASVPASMTPKPFDKKHIQRPCLPFILKIPDQTEFLEADALLSFSFVLIADATEALPHLILALKHLGKKGIGRKNKGAKNQFHLHQVEVEAPDGKELIYQEDEIMAKGYIWQGISHLSQHQNSFNVQLSIHSPIRAKINGKLLEDIELLELFKLIQRRISAFIQVYQPNVKLNIEKIIHDTKNIELEEKTLYWHDWASKQFKKKNRMYMGGVMGSLRIHGLSKEQYLLLKLGELLHVGKSSTFGLGQFTLEELNTDLHSFPQILQIKPWNNTEFWT